jgi:hypothetical protein
MPFSGHRRIQIVLAVVVLALPAVACNQAASGSKRPTKHTARKGGPTVPAVVNGMPLLDLAKHALGAAEAYSVSKPVDVRAVATTQAALYAQVPASGGSTRPEYVVVLQGRFSCGACGTSIATPARVSTTTTDPASVRPSTMVLQLPLPLTSGTNGVAVGVGMPHMAELGRVYDLGAYVKSLAGVTVPVGPLPG